MINESFLWAILVGTILPIISIGVAFFCLCLRCISCIDDLCGKEKTKDDTSINLEMTHLGNESNMPIAIIEMEPPEVPETDPPELLALEPQEIPETEARHNNSIEIAFVNTDSTNVSPPSYNEVLKSDSAPPTYSESINI